MASLRSFILMLLIGVVSSAPALESVLEAGDDRRPVSNAEQNQGENCESEKLDQESADDIDGPAILEIAICEHFVVSQDLSCGSTFYVGLHGLSGGCSRAPPVALS